MGKIIIPGAQNVEEKNVFNATEVIKTEIEQLKELAQDLGYPSIKELVKVHMRSFNDSGFIQEKFEDFLKAVQTHASREPISTGNWNENNVFEEFLYLSKKEVEVRLEQLSDEFNKGVIAYSGLLTVAKSMPEKDVNIPQDLCKSINKEDREFYTMILRKSLEAINKALGSDKFLEDSIRGQKNRLNEKTVDDQNFIELAVKQVDKALNK
jgi:ATP-dependent Lon protease